MLKNKGFTVLETLIVVVMMTTSLLMIYSSYSSLISNEKKRVYYDDVVDIYRTDYLKNYLLEFSNYELFIEASFNGGNASNSMYINIGSSSESLFISTDAKTNFTSITNFFEVERIIIFKADFTILSQCTNERIYSTSVDSSFEYDSKCRGLANLGDYNLIEYLRSLGSSTDFSSGDYLLVVAYNKDSESRSTYSYSFLGGADE